MKENILIVEDEFIVANDLRLMLTKAGYEVCGIAVSVHEAIELLEKNQPTWVLLDIFLQDGSMGTEFAAHLNKHNIGFIYISANTNQSILETAKATQPYGFVVKPFREKDLLIMLDIARQKHQSNLQFSEHREMIIQSHFQSIIDEPGDIREKLSRIPAAFQASIPFDYMKINLGTKNNVIDEYSFVRESFDRYQMLTNQELHEIMGFNSEFNKYRPKFPLLQQSSFNNGIDYKRSLMNDVWEKLLSNHFTLASQLTMVTKLKTGELAMLSFYSNKPEEYSPGLLISLQKAESLIQQLVALFKDQLPQPPVRISIKNIANSPSLSPALNIPIHLDGIVGNSPALLEVIKNVKLVAPTPVAVLIQGDSGTGKERIAKSIHKLSDRKLNTLITINCAAIPADLIESELFGHEKGAFTGAVERRIGKFELANDGTVFLDEIGELPLELQVKLLRVLQEKEFERVGSSKTITVDVRIIAATNRNLEKEVAEGRFRLDLYYRLNVFPIELPSLKDRKEDIPWLTQYFISRQAERINPRVKGINEKALQQLMSYDWPGNIRELEHVLERNFLLTSGNMIEEIILPSAIKTSEHPVASDGYIFKMKTLEEMEADHIIAVIKKCNGKIGGSGGAAEILGLPSSTLNSKIKKLGISRDVYFNL